jgi:BirA family biotin operon repressor/biotin-[acetyl-CoA-carboxylase] ligase
MTTEQTPSGFELIRLDSVPSTNEYIRQGLPAGVDLDLPVFVLADEQSSGRGRLGRSWHSPRGGIYMSLLWPELLTPVQALSLPLLSALAVRSAIQPLTDQSIMIKWPNDLQIVRDEERCKLVGILVELAGDRAIIGIGVNVYQTQPAVDAGLAQAWLADKNMDAVTSAALLQQAVDGLIHSLIDYLKRWQDAGRTFRPFVDEYQRYLAQVGEYVEVRSATGDLLAAGKVSGISEQGQLVVLNEDGLQAISSGEVTLRSDRQDLS